MRRSSTASLLHISAEDTPDGPPPDWLRQLLFGFGQEHPPDISEIGDFADDLTSDDPDVRVEARYFTPLRAVDGHIQTFGSPLRSWYAC